MTQEQANQMIAEGKVQPRTSYTYGDLLAYLQTKSPEQLQQQVWGWDEEKCYDRLGLRELEEDYVSDGENYAPVSDHLEGATQEELDEMEEWPRLPKGTLVFQIGE